MNYLELKEEMGKKPMAFYNNQPEPEPTSNDFIEKMFRWHFWEIYREDLIIEINEIADELNEDLRKRFSFFVDPKKEEEYCFGELHKLQESYLSNSFANIFSIDNFLSDFFDISKFETLADLIFFKEQFRFDDWCFAEYKQDPSGEMLYDILEKELDDIDLALRIVIKSNFLKSKLKDFRKTEYNSNSEDTKLLKRLSRNQLVILLDKLGVINSSLEGHTVVDKAKILSNITGHNYSNIKKSIEGLEKNTDALKPQEMKDIEIVDNFLESFKLND